MKRRLWGAVACLLVAGVSLGAPSTDGQEAGRAVFQVRCGLCHQLPEPDALSPRKWHRVLELMQRRMKQADMVPLDEEEFAQVLDYLSAHAR